MTSFVIIISDDLIIFKCKSEMKEVKVDTGIINNLISQDEKHKIVMLNKYNVEKRMLNEDNKKSRITD